LRKVVFSLLSILALAMIGLLVWHFLRVDGQEEAVLFLEEGSATLRRGSGEVLASSSEVIEVGEGDVIETGSDSRALLVLSPDATIELTPGTEALLRRLQLSKKSGATLELEVRRGETWHELSPSLEPELRYEVFTPSAEVALTAGRHRVAVDDDGSTHVEVSEGAAKVRALASEVEVRAGEHTSVALGRAPSVPRPMVARFLFVSGRENGADIWLLDDEGQEFQLTYDEADDLAPVWSPDGSRIAFESTRHGNSEIYVMNADGSNQVNVSNHPADDGAPAWSPDGTMIAFVSLRDGQEEIYLMNADGSEQGRLTTGPGLKLAPSWLEDGQEIVFSRIEADSNADGMIDSRDMAAFFCLDVRSGTVQSFWDGKTILDQMTFPWGRRRVG
jgi:dipeptidyl aminopeptidase/acylaminoacyl peptidase